jgi:hypothetical protein
MKALIIGAFLLASLGVAAAQAPAGQPSGAPKHTGATKKTAPAAGRNECALAVRLCVMVPVSWRRLGDIFDDLGFVVAEPHAGTDSATWPQLTVAAIDVPPVKGGEAPSLDALVDIVLTPDGSFTSSETLQRTHLILNGGDAEIIRVRLHDDVNKSEAVEEIALIEGDEGLVYSIALRCAPQDFARLEPVFQTAAHSWHIKAAAAVPAPQSKPKQDSEKK